MAQRRNTLIRRKQIIDAARKIIINRGSEYITIREIACQVGISEADVYRHFKSKGDILSILAQNTETSLIADIQKAHTNNGSTLQTVNFILRKHISAVEQRKGISFQVITGVAILGNGEINRQFSGIVNNYVLKIAALISSGIKSGEIREDIEPVSAAIMLYGMIQGLTNVWTLNNHDFNLIERYAYLWDIFKRAVAKFKTDADLGVKEK
ncbi:MAG: TetR/AcrR family transcriptional regulator [Dehalococcoidales bacterium]|nr:TetR/AcrR family transcriptional regulator [Dehalococcoidales bacterium]